MRGGGFFTEAEPDVMLTEVHRQAKDDPIVRMAMTIREGGRLELGTYGQSRVVSRRALDPAEVLECDQVLVGLNKTRRLYNARLRNSPATPIRCRRSARSWSACATTG